ncbi:MAG: hypothetical protein FWD25_10810 [Clostridia bacterium]|nr:hypothetical protein [Clostridia bacterium]
MSDIAKRMLLVVGALWLLLVAASAIYYRSMDFLPFALGALLGVALNVVKILMLDRAVKNAVRMDEVRAGGYIRLQHFLRLMLTGLVFVLAALVPFISLWGAAAGVLTLQVALFFAKRFPNDPKSVT